MAVSAGSVTVTTTPTLLSAAADADAISGHSVLVRVPSGGATVYLGGPDVTAIAAGGFPTVSGEPYTFDLQPGDFLYGIVAASTQTVNTLRTGA